MEVRTTIGCRPISHLVIDRRLRLFGHIAGSSQQDPEYLPTGSDRLGRPHSAHYIVPLQCFGFFPKTVVSVEGKDKVIRWLQLRFDFDTTRVRLPVKGH